MDTFAVTSHGFPSYIKDTQREGFVEPLHMSGSSKLLKPDASLPEKVAVCDVYHPNVDGHSYSSHELSRLIRRKGIPKPTGPRDEFRLPATTAMDYGWYNDDPDLCADWFVVRCPAPRICSDTTRKYTINEYGSFFIIAGLLPLPYWFLGSKMSVANLFHLRKLQIQLRNKTRYALLSFVQELFKV